MKQKKTKDPRIGIVGGQAVLEGVMMRSGDRCSLAVRTPDGGISLHSRHISLVHPVRKTPLELTAPLPSSWRGMEAFV